MGEYVTIREAAARLGISRDTVRRRLTAGELAGEKRDTPQGETWFVELPDDAPAPAGEAAPAASPAPESGLPSAELVELHVLRAQTEDLRRQLEDARKDRDVWRASFVELDKARRDEIAELASVLAQAQALAAARSISLEAGPDDPGEGVPRTGDNAGATGGGVLERLRRAFRS